MSETATLTERDRRFAQIREAMAKDNLVALIVGGHGASFTRGYIRYFSDAHMWAGDSLIIIPLDGEPVHVLVANADASMPDKLWIPDYRKNPNPHDEIVSVMKQRGITKGRVGIGGFDKVITVGAYETLRNSFPNISFVNSDMLVDRVRARKSALEIRQIREHLNFSRKAMDKFVEIASPEITEREAAAEVVKVARVGGIWDDLTKIQVSGVSVLPRDIALDCSDLLGFHLEICGPSGHWSELNVTCAFREPTAAETGLLKTELRAFEEVCKMAKPGVTLGEFATAFEQAIVEDGWKLGEPEWHYFLHGQGMDSIEWPYYTRMLEENRDVPLEEGMVFSYHPHRDTVPSAGNPRVFDDIVITETGAERLSGDWDLGWRIMQ